jgi:hypothetical protein
MRVMGEREIRTPLVLSAIGLALLVGLLLFLVGRPLATDDLWWHIAMGQVYATRTLWPRSDPMLFTSGDRTPMQHEWAFGAAVWALDQGVGLQGLRVVHVLAVVGIIAFAFLLFRREAGRTLPATFATTVFLVLSWRRLQQLRPDLFSIAAMLALHPLLFERPPSWRRVALAAALFGVWANVHSVFVAGLLLAAAGCAGIAVRSWLEGRANATAEPGGGARVAVAVALGALVALLNPRGIHQHLTFVEHTGGSAIWEVRDEWARFPLFAPPEPGTPGLDLLSWTTAWILIVVFLAVATVSGLLLLRNPPRAPGFSSSIPCEEHWPQPRCARA